MVTEGEGIVRWRDGRRFGLRRPKTKSRRQQQDRPLPVFVFSSKGRASSTIKRLEPMMDMSLCVSPHSFFLGKKSTIN